MRRSRTPCHAGSGRQTFRRTARGESLRASSRPTNRRSAPRAAGNRTPSRCGSLPPDFVMTLTTPPAVRPNSAGAPLAITWNSFTASSVMSIGRALAAGLLAEEPVVEVAAVEADVVEHAALAGERDFVAVGALHDAHARRQREQVFELAAEDRRRLDRRLIQRHRDRRSASSRRPACR